jgi:superfamily I DNA/RNA helicase
LDAVEVTTIHGAKGREWPVVCVIDTNLPSLRSGQVEHVLWDEEWKLVISDNRANARAGAPDPLGDLRRDLRRRARNEERSIWYVGLTRARDRLIVTHSDCELDGHGHFEDARAKLARADEQPGDEAVHFFHELWEHVRARRVELGEVVFWGPGPCSGAERGF